MTVSTTDSVIEYVSGGPAFPIPYRFLQNSDILAVLVKQDGSSETLVLGSQYTLSGAGAQNGGTLTSAYAAGFLSTPGASLAISRDMSPVQPTDLRNQGRFLAETHETVFDRLTMLIQQGFTAIRRALLRPLGKNYYDAEGRLIKNVGDGSADLDAVNIRTMRSYVDAAIAGVVGGFGWFLQSGVGAIYRTFQSKMRDTVSVKDFGALGDGVTDDTAAFLAAIASGHSQLYVPSGTYLVNGSLLVSKRVFSVYGAGVGSTIMVFNPSATAVLWDYIKDTTNKDVFTLRDMTIVTETAGIATPVRISGEIRADALQVNGANDASVIENVSVLSNTGYWQRGLHIRNTGGNHTTNLKVENNTIAQSTPGNSGILIETTDSRVALIRAIHATDTYVLRAHRSVEVRSFSNARPIESVYFNGGEFVGCDTGLYGSGAISAMDISALHFDVINRCVDTSLCLTSVARFTSCDFRKGSNGGAMSNGYMIAHDFGELVTYSGCTFSGINHLSPSALNGAFLFTNALTGTGLNRSTIAGCAFRNLNHVYSTTPALSSVSTAANTYAVIAATVHLDSPSDNSITKQESIVVDSFMQALGTSGDERVSRAIPGEIFYPSAYPIVLVNIETDTGTDNVKIEYMFSESSGTNMVFRVRGNTTARSVRIGFAAMPASYILGI